MVQSRSGKAATMEIKLKVTKNGNQISEEKLDPEKTFPYHIKAFKRRDNSNEKNNKAEKAGDYARRDGGNSFPVISIPSCDGGSKRSKHKAFKHIAISKQ